MSSATPTGRLVRDVPARVAWSVTPLLVSVDRAAFAVALALALRRAGASVGVTSMESLTRALEICPPASRHSLYWVARVTLVKRQSDLQIFDATFGAIFDDASLDLGPRGRRDPVAPVGEEGDAYAPIPAATGEDDDGAGLPWATLPSVVATAEDGDESPLEVPERRPSDLEGVADEPFEALGPADLALLDGWLASALADWPTRRSRRRARHHAGHRVELRPSLARARRTGFEPIELVRTRPLDKARRVVMLCDVSQSMRPHAAAYLHLMRAVALRTDAEVFAFSTYLTRLTADLGTLSAEAAIERATTKVVDRFGGTKIATNLAALLGSCHGEACRGAIVLVASDGWDNDPPEELAKVMARLGRRAHRVIWVNPRAAAPGFAPLVGAMAAALPYCDELIGADTIRSLSAVVAALVASG